MILNEQIGRLTEVDAVRDFIAQHKMMPINCSWDKGNSLLLVREPYVLEFQDALIENYLETTLAELSSGLLISGSSALGCSIDMGLQDLQALRLQNFDDHPLAEIFLSFQSQKMLNLHCFLGAFDALMKKIEERGLISMLNGNFDPEFDLSTSVESMSPNMVEKYRLCINSHH